MSRKPNPPVSKVSEKVPASTSSAVPEGEVKISRKAEINPETLEARAPLHPEDVKLSIFSKAKKILESPLKAELKIEENFLSGAEGQIFFRYDKKFSPADDIRECYKFSISKDSKNEDKPSVCKIRMALTMLGERKTWQKVKSEEINDLTDLYTILIPLIKSLRL